MITLSFNESGLGALRLPDKLTAEELLQQRELLDRIAPSLQRLDDEIRQLKRPSQQSGKKAAAGQSDRQI